MVMSNQANIAQSMTQRSQRFAKQLTSDPSKGCIVRSDDRLGRVEANPTLLPARQNVWQGLETRSIITQLSRVVSLYLGVLVDQP